MSAQVVSFNCILKNKAGEHISSTFNRDVVLSNQKPGDFLAGLSKRLMNLTKGEKRRIALPAEEAYGTHDLRKVILFPLKSINREVKVGESITIAGKSGVHRTYLVTQIHGDMVSLDGNHPLAGQDLICEIEALDVREATGDEIKAKVTDGAEAPAKPVDAVVSQKTTFKRSMPKRPTRVPVKA